MTVIDRGNTMRLHATIAVATAALTMAFAAQAAEANTANQCPGDTQVIIGDDGIPSCGPTIIEPLVVLAQNGNNEEVTVSTTVENGSELLPEGTVIEVEIDFDDVVAALDPIEARTVYRAAINEGGMNPATASSATDPGNAADVAAVLTEAEMTVAANYLSASLQNRSTGRSDPAGPNTTRHQATDQGLTRAIADWIRNPSIPGLKINSQGRVREYYPNGQLRRETGPVFSIEVG